jgi:molybdate transport system substrate-binding protein
VWRCRTRDIVALGRGRAEPIAGAGAADRSITVFAGSSLTDAFKKAGDQLKVKNPGTDFTFNFGSSSTLATQIVNLAPADVFASADEANMQKIVDAKLNDGTPAIFVSNRLQIAVAAGNPKGIAGLADLARPGLIVVLAAPTVPAGKYALESLQKAGVAVKVASQEVDVRAVLNKVTLGEADAGIVYVTDLKSAGAKGDRRGHPGAAPGDRPVPDRRREGNEEPADGEGVRRLPPLGRRPETARGVRVLETVRAARPPFAIAALAAIGVAFFALPLAGLIYRVSWQTALSDLFTEEALLALRLSLLVSIAATALGLLSAFHSHGSTRASRFPGATWSARSRRCRWCCRPSSVVSRCS